MAMVGIYRCRLLTNTSVSTLPPRYFTNFTHLTSLVMENNLISEIPVGSFDGLEQLRYLFILGNRIQQLKKGTFSHMAKLRWLLLKGNRLSFLDSDVFEGLESLQILKLDSNRLRLNDGTLYLPQSLRFLYLDNNRIEEVTSKTFSANKLYTLKLNQNKICYLSEDAFHGMRSLVDLRLDENKITQLPARMFKYPNKIETLHIGNNPYDALPPNIFDHLQDLTSLNMSNIEITNIDERLFQHLNKLQHGYFKKFYYCRFVPQARDCFPKGDGISTTSNLLDRTMLRAFVWIVAVVTCAGNTMVIILRFVLKDEHSIHSLFIKNLGAADFTMGIYLFVIGCHDILFRDEYNKYTLSWTNSWGCQATGFLAMMSCEVSVLILAFMSVERCITITSPLKARPLTRRRATLCLSIIWATGMLLAMVPIVSSDLLGNFYGINGVCFPLHIHDPFMLGWQYSAFVFIVVNLVAMSVIGVSYCLMYCSISRTQQGVTVPSAHDTGVAKRFFLIVLTDALCWVPIICIKLLALAQITISTSLYAWLAVFILPINSALNPILYSFTTAVFRKKIAELYRHFQKRHIAASFMTTSSRMRSRGSSCSASGFTAYTSGSSKDVTMISDRKESHSDLITQQSKPLMAITEDPITTATPNMADVHM